MASFQIECSPGIRFDTGADCSLAPTRCGPPQTKAPESSEHLSVPLRFVRDLHEIRARWKTGLAVRTMSRSDDFPLVVNSVVI